MKIQIIPDLHGSNIWEQLIDLSNDKIIFLGDYIDNYHIGLDEQLDNFRKIIKLKMDNPDKVTLLLGNHDISYFYDENFRVACSSNNFIGKHKTDLLSLYSDNRDLFKFVDYHYSEINNKFYIFSHAGINAEYMISFLSKHKIEKNNYEQLSKALSTINSNYKDYWLLITSVGRRRGGLYDYGGITWCDVGELYSSYKNISIDKLYSDDIVFIIGHSKVDSYINKSVFNVRIVLTDIIPKDPFDGDLLDGNMNKYVMLLDIDSNNMSFGENIEVLD